MPIIFYRRILAANVYRKSNFKNHTLDRGTGQVSHDVSAFKAIPFATNLASPRLEKFRLAHTERGIGS